MKFGLNSNIDLKLGSVKGVFFHSATFDKNSHFYRPEKEGGEVRSAESRAFLRYRLFGRRAGILISRGQKDRRETDGEFL